MTPALPHPLTPEVLALLVGAAFLTATLSAVVGMAGGMTLLVVMLQFLDPLVALPLHGAVQLVSNATRVGIQREHVRWRVVGPFALLLLPAGLLAFREARDLPQGALRLAIGAFVLLATWAPGLLRRGGAAPDPAQPRSPLGRFVLLGGAAGALNVTLGATGPLIAPFFLDLGLSRHEVIGTKAACQSLGHLAKLAVFGLAGFAFAAYLGPLALLALAVVAGTWAGSHVLERVNERWFVRLYRSVLTLLALRLVWRAALGA